MGDQELIRPVTWAPLLVPREAWSEIDEALFGPQDLFNVEEAEAERLRLRAIHRSLRYHFKMNPFYRALCADRGFRPEDVKTVEDLAKVPLIPESIFKGCGGPSEFLKWLEGLGPEDLEYPPVHDQSSYDSIIDELQNSGITVTYSSGTSGKFTFVPHDELTWKRARYAIGIGGFHMIPLYFELMSSADNCNLLLVMPHPSRTHLFMARATGGSADFFPNAKIHPTISRTISTRVLSLSQGRAHGLRDRALAQIMKRITSSSAAKADYQMVELMKNLEREGRGGTLGGPPFWIARILSKIEQSAGSLSLGDQWIVITGGGWKMAEFAKISEREFGERVSRTLGIPQSNIRDLYSMSECNVSFPSCEGHYKHIPSTVLQPFILDEDLEPVSYGTAGRFAFLDPLARSYPGFVIMSDRARMLEHCPACSRPGPVLDPDITRMPGVDDRGCASVMRRFVEGET
jgi:hypothetical protein